MKKINRVESQLKVKLKGAGVEKGGRMRRVADKVMLLQIIICIKYMINVNMSNCKYLNCMNVV